MSCLVCVPVDDVDLLVSVGGQRHGELTAVLGEDGGLQATSICPNAMMKIIFKFPPGQAPATRWAQS